LAENVARLWVNQHRAAIVQPHDHARLPAMLGAGHGQAGLKTSRGEEAGELFELLIAALNVAQHEMATGF
jgi:hypothetical protein